MVMREATKRAFSSIKSGWNLMTRQESRWAFPFFLLIPQNYIRSILSSYIDQTSRTGLNFLAIHLNSSFF